MIGVLGNHSRQERRGTVMSEFVGGFESLSFILVLYILLVIVTMGCLF
jgi:hypothetical protein